VHWWYLPDSYDECITRAPEMSLDAERSPNGSWKVRCVCVCAGFVSWKGEVVTMSMCMRGGGGLMVF
jgi:hypothetical protein